MTIRILSRVFQDVYQGDRRPQGTSEGGFLYELSFDKGIDKILKKVGEECTEIVIAAKIRTKKKSNMRFQIFSYHAMVLMVEKGVTWEDITRELARR